MNSGEVGQQKLNAKMTTEEIDRATDLAAKELTESKARALARSEAGNLGNRILTYNPEQEAKIITDTEQVTEKTEIDNGYEVAARSGNENLVGVETGIQIKDHLEEDRDMVRTEQGDNGPYAQNIMERNNKRLTKATVAKVDRLISEKNYHPGELDEMMNRSRMNFLKDVFNRILGSRN